MKRPKHKIGINTWEDSTRRILRKESVMKQLLPILLSGLHPAEP
jgi:hypothetical protein